MANTNESLRKVVLLVLIICCCEPKSRQRQLSGLLKVTSGLRAIQISRIPYST